MQRSVDEFGSAEDLVIWNWTAAVLAVHSAIFLTLVGLAMGYPGASEWLSAAVQGEFRQDRRAGRTDADCGRQMGGRN
jgi:hypothetical protein